MIYFNWPDTLTYRPLLNDWNYTLGSTITTRTEMDGGDIRQRDEAGGADSMTWSQLFTPAQMTTFWSFIDEVGSARFLMYVPVRGGNYELRVVQIQNGLNGLRIDKVGVKSKVSFIIDIFDDSLVPEFPLITSADTSIIGSGDEGATVEIELYLNNSLFFTDDAVVSGGTWSILLPYLPLGTYTIRRRYANSSWSPAESINLPGAF